MKTKFITVYDYGTGGVWRYIYAESAGEIQKKYPRLKVLDREPSWFGDEHRKYTLECDIDDPPDVFLKGMMQP